METKVKQGMTAEQIQIYLGHSVGFRYLEKNPKTNKMKHRNVCGKALRIEDGYLFLETSDGRILKLLISNLI